MTQSFLAILGTVLMVIHAVLVVVALTIKLSAAIVTIAVLNSTAAVVIRCIVYEMQRKV